MLAGFCRGDSKPLFGVARFSIQIKMVGGGTFQSPQSVFGQVVRCLVLFRRLLWPAWDLPVGLGLTGVLAPVVFHRLGGDFLGGCAWVVSGLSLWLSGDAIFNSQPKQVERSGLGYLAVGGGVGHDLHAFAAGDLDDRGRAVFDPLPFAAGDRLDPTVRTCGDAPQAVDRFPRERPVESRGYDQQVDIAPLTRMSRGVRAEENSHARHDALARDVAQVLSDDL